MPLTPLTPFAPQRPLIWPDSVLDLADLLVDEKMPVYIVGGAVRDAYLHRPIHDIDLTVPADAIKLARRIANRLGGDFYALDPERDVGRVLLKTPDLISGALPIIDIARMRGENLLDDLTDRDFTLNAIAVHVQGDLSHVIDPLDGIKDLTKRIIRRCSQTALADDPLRALRAVRQSVQFNGHIEASTLADVRAAAGMLTSISAERIRDEFFKLLAGPRPAASLRIAEAVGLLREIVPEAIELKGEAGPPPGVFDAWNHTLMVVEKLDGILAAISPKRTDQTAAVFDFGMIVMALDRFRKALQAHLAVTWPEDRTQRALLLLGALLHNSPSDIVAARCSALRLSTDEKKRITAAVAAHILPFNLPATISDLELHRYWYGLGTAGVDGVLLALADHLGAYASHLNQDEWIAHIDRAAQLLDAYYNRADQIVEPPALLDGAQLIQALGISPGPVVGELLTIIREGQVTGEITTREEAIAAARAHLNSA